MKNINTHCPNGHEYTKENTYINPNSGYRRCRMCISKSAAKWNKENPDKKSEQNKKWWREHGIKRTGIAQQRNSINMVERVYRSILFERDKGICGICGLPVDPNIWQVDHIIPIAKGGEHSYKNAQVSHPLCNAKKGDKFCCW